MGQFNDPTISGIVSEGMRQALGRAATSGEVARGLDIWIPEIHGDIWFGSNTHKLIETTTMVLLQEGQQVYDLPSDCESVIDLTVLDGAARGTLQSATASTATLAATDTAPATARIGRELITLSGIGSGQRRTIYGWTAPQATSLSANWSTLPTSSTTYLVADIYKEVRKMLEDAFLQESDRTMRDRPNRWVQHARTYAVFPVPDQIYPLLIRYWVALARIDIASTAMTDLLKTWRSLYHQGIFVKTLRDEDDARYDKEEATYRGMISVITGKSAQSGLLTPDT